MGGTRLILEGMSSSSSTIELAGLVEILSVLTSWITASGAEPDRRPGAIAQYADNKGVVASSEGPKPTLGEQRQRKARILHYKKDRLKEVLSKYGVDFSSRWVKGHVDLTAKPAYLWTLAERMNIVADRMATEQKREAGRVDLHSTLPAEWAGGQWIWREMSQDGGPQISWADGVNDLLKNAALGMESRRYWKARRAGTPVRGTEDMEQPNWDDVVARAIVAKCAKNTGSDVFRLQLWWDHLPSQARNARQQPKGDSPLQCDFCSHKGPVGAWHILSACMNDEVVETRKAVTEQLAVAIKEVSDKTATTRLAGLLQTMRMNKGNTKWQQPPGWDSQGLTKAGSEPNPWYDGLFPVAWRSKGNHPLSVEAQIIREPEITTLSKVGKVAIQGCETIWATATKVWATRMNNLRFASRPRPPATQKTDKSGGGWH